MTLPQGAFEYFLSCLVMGLVGWVMYVGTRHKEPAKREPERLKGTSVSTPGSPRRGRSEGLHLVEAKAAELELPRFRVVRITKRNGGSLTQKETAIVTAAASKFVAESEEFKVDPATAAFPPQKMNGTWAQEGRTLVHTSHNVAHQPVRLSVAHRSPASLSKGVAK